MGKNGRKAMLKERHMENRFDEKDSKVRSDSFSSCSKDAAEKVLGNESKTGRDSGKVYCLLNHSLTGNQLAELQEKYGAGEVLYPDERLAATWAQVPVTPVLDRGVIQAVTGWLSAAKEGDVLVVQGEFGSTFMIVDYALGRGLVPLHAVARRIALEHREGEKVLRQYVFEHVCFRRYERFPDAACSRC